MGDSDNQNTAQIEQQEPVMNDGELPLEATEEEIKQEKRYNRKVWSIISIITAAIPVLIWLYCLTVSGGSANENGSGAIWWLLVIYYWTLGFPLAITSVITGIIGLNTRLRSLAAVSLLIKVIMIVLVVFRLFIR